MTVEKPRVLIVEDEPTLAEGLMEALTFQGYECEIAADGLVGEERARKGEFDLLILDVMLPERSGFEVIKQLRKEGNKIPTIMLTAKGADEDKVRGLKMGADDYVTKPFGLPELMARVGAQLRRARMARGDGETFEIDGMHFDLGRLQAKREAETINLTPREGEILRHLRSREGNVVTRDEFLLDVWGYPTANVETRTVDNTLAALRKKVERDPARPAIIVTVRGKGYRWGG
ncbi:MAG: response regulator transcription factor [Planctomycetota bacterium]|nr:response regulator transcription factor [Planctomycetota bacterium]